MYKPSQLFSSFLSPKYHLKHTNKPPTLFSHSIVYKTVNILPLKPPFCSILSSCHLQKLPQIPTYHRNNSVYLTNQRGFSSKLRSYRSIRDIALKCSSISLRFPHIPSDSLTSILQSSAPQLFKLQLGSGLLSVLPLSCAFMALVGVGAGKTCQHYFMIEKVSISDLFSLPPSSPPPTPLPRTSSISSWLSSLFPSTLASLFSLSSGDDDDDSNDNDHNVNQDSDNNNNNNTDDAVNTDTNIDHSLHTTLIITDSSPSPHLIIVAEDHITPIPVALSIHNDDNDNDDDDSNKDDNDDNHSHYDDKSNNNDHHHDSNHDHDHITISLSPLDTASLLHPPLLELIHNATTTDTLTPPTTTTTTNDDDNNNNNTIIIHNDDHIDGTTTTATTDAISTITNNIYVSSDNDIDYPYNALYPERLIGYNTTNSHDDGIFTRRLKRIINILYPDDIIIILDRATDMLLDYFDLFCMVSFVDVSFLAASYLCHNTITQPLSIIYTWNIVPMHILYYSITLYIISAVGSWATTVDREFPLLSHSIDVISSVKTIYDADPNDVIRIVTKAYENNKDNITLLIDQWQHDMKEKLIDSMSINMEPFQFKKVLSQFNIFNNKDNIKDNNNNTNTNNNMTSSSTSNTQNNDNANTTTHNVVATPSTSNSSILPLLQTGNKRNKSGNTTSNTTLLANNTQDSAVSTPSTTQTKQQQQQQQQKRMEAEIERIIKEIFDELKGIHDVQRQKEYMWNNEDDHYSHDIPTVSTRAESLKEAQKQSKKMSFDWLLPPKPSVSTPSHANPGIKSSSSSSQHKPFFAFYADPSTNVPSFTHHISQTFNNLERVHHRQFYDSIIKEHQDNVKNALTKLSQYISIPSSYTPTNTTNNNTNNTNKAILPFIPPGVPFSLSVSQLLHRNNNNNQQQQLPLSSSLSQQVFNIENGNTNAITPNQQHSHQYCKHTHHFDLLHDLISDYFHLNKHYDHNTSQHTASSSSSSSYPSKDILLGHLRTLMMGNTPPQSDINKNNNDIILPSSTNPPLSLSSSVSESTKSSTAPPSSPNSSNKRSSTS